MKKKRFTQPSDWAGILLVRLLSGHSLSERESRTFFEGLFEDLIPLSKAKAFLLLLAKRGETADELLGCLKALRSIEKTVGPRIPGLMDTCGTGGDGRQTLNISTLAALVMAGAGAKIAKHGNRSISSKSGSSDLMEAFGVRLDAGPVKMINAVKQVGLGYFHAPYFHPVFAKLQSLRQSIKKRTLLNLLGPLVNPMRLECQMVGVSCKRLVPLYARVLSKMGRRTAFVFHSDDGMDEISTAAPTHGVWITPKGLRTEVIQPGDYGLQRASMKELKVTSVRESQLRALNILKGSDRGPACDTILLNAAVGLKVCHCTPTVTDGLRIARRSLDSGKAFNVLQRLKELSQ